MRVCKFPHAFNNTVNSHCLFFQLEKIQKPCFHSLGNRVTAIASFYLPATFKEISRFELSTLVISLIMVIISGMASTLSLQYFKRVTTMPVPAIIGLLCQFAIMPVIGFCLVQIFLLPLEIAAGVILVGYSPSGLASKVIALIARADVLLCQSPLRELPQFFLF